MEFRQLIQPNLTTYQNAAELNKKKVLEIISRLTSQWDEGIKYQDVLEALQRREKIGDTTIGHGVAIPHARITGLDKPLCVIISLSKAINFSSQENIPVDLVFGLLVPKEKNDEHIEILATLAEKLKNHSYCQKLRETTTDDALYQAALA